MSLGELRTEVSQALAHAREVDAEIERRNRGRALSRKAASGLRLIDSMGSGLDAAERELAQEIFNRVRTEHRRASKVQPTTLPLFADRVN